MEEEEEALDEEEDEADPRISSVDLGDDGLLVPPSTPTGLDVCKGGWE